MAGEITKFPNARSSGAGDGHKQARAPKIKVKSVPGKPLKIDMEPNDAVRLLSAFGTAEAGFANLMLSGIINAACSKRPGSEDVNATLAAVTGIEACDEIEGMLATQMVATHLAAITALRRLKGSIKLAAPCRRTENPSQDTPAVQRPRSSDLRHAARPPAASRHLRAGAVMPPAIALRSSTPAPTQSGKQTRRRGSDPSYPSHRSATKTRAPRYTPRQCTLLMH
jgi:hypothetical protein